jgi:hypothetical protein
MISAPVQLPEQKLKDGRNFNFVCRTCKHDIVQVQSPTSQRGLRGKFNCSNNSCKNKEFWYECLICHNPRKLWADKEEEICIGCGISIIQGKIDSEYENRFDEWKKQIQKNYPDFQIKN